MSVIASRDNPRVKRWRALTRDARARRKESRAIIEGDHLVTACLGAGWKLEALILSKSSSGKFERLAKLAGTAAVLADSVFRSISDTEAPTGIAAEIALPDPKTDLRTAQSCVFLESIQDAGNVGTILRSAAAFGIGQAVLGPGCADAWSPKVLRAGMGAHFSLQILETADLPAAIAQFGGRTACTVVRGGTPLQEAELSGRLGWIFGSEGRGVSDAMARTATLKLSIPMPGAAESLNVSAAAAICFYEAFRRGKPGKV
jgi:TrmH family RNA methyltransferase